MVSCSGAAMLHHKFIVCILLYRHTVSGDETEILPTAVGEVRRLEAELPLRASYCQLALVKEGCRVQRVRSNQMPSRAALCVRSNQMAKGCTVCDVQPDGKQGCTVYQRAM